jgi:hypothetical protein
MRLPTTVPLFLILPYTTNALTYWLHSSCLPGRPIQPPIDSVTSGKNIKRRWDVLFDEIRETGKSARIRLMNSGQDADFTRAFNTIFKNQGDLNAPIDQGAEVVRHLMRYFVSLEGMRWEKTQVLADLRICKFSFPLLQWKY